MNHLGFLERLKWINVWTDNQIKVGESWEKEINCALSESKVAVLLISPLFLSSKFIWREEIPIIMKHREEGMLVIPLIIKPCAWQLEHDLEQLQARPANGRPLSTGVDPQIDLDLAAFVYELASYLKPNSPSTHFVNLHWEIAEQFRYSHFPNNISTIHQLSSKNNHTSTLFPFINKPLPLSWIGNYNPDQELKLTILTVNQDRIKGIITYLNDNDGGVTHMEGRVGSDYSHLANDHIWTWIKDKKNVDLSQVECAIEFWETKYEQKGARGIDFKGSYFGLIINQTILGIWVRDVLVGEFSFEISESVDLG